MRAQCTATSGNTFKQTKKHHFDSMCTGNTLHKVRSIAQMTKNVRLLGLKATDMQYVSVLLEGVCRGTDQILFCCRYFNGMPCIIMHFPAQLCFNVLSVLSHICRKVFLFLLLFKYTLSCCPITSSLNKDDNSHTNCK